MAQEDTYNLKYVGPRFALYLILFLAAATDSIIHRHVKRRGYQLQRFVTVTVGAWLSSDDVLSEGALGSASFARTEPSGASINSICSSIALWNSV